VSNPIRSGIVIPLALAETLVWAACYYSFPALLLHWEADFGWSRTQLTGAMTSSLIVSACLAPVVGRAIDAGRGQLVFSGSAFLGGSALIGLSLVETWWQFYAVWIVIGTAMSGCLYEPCFAIVTRCGGKHAKRAITHITLIAGLAGTVSFPSAHLLSGAFGWRGTVVVFGAVVILVAVPLMWNAAGAAESGRAVTPAPEQSDEKIQTTLLRSPVFWLLAIAFAMSAVNHAGLVTHLLAIANERGISPSAAVLAASLMGPMQVFGRLMMMAVERHVTMIGIGLGCFAGLALASSVLLATSSLPLLLFVFVLIQGASFGVTSIARPVITAHLLGEKNFGTVSGMIAMPFIFGAAISPSLSAVIWSLGGYDLVIAMMIGFAIAAFVALFLADRFARKNAPAEFNQN